MFHQVARLALGRVLLLLPESVPFAIFCGEPVVRPSNVENVASAGTSAQPNCSHTVCTVVFQDAAVWSMPMTGRPARTFSADATKHSAT